MKKSEIFIEEQKLIKNYNDHDGYKDWEGLARTGEFASLIDCADLDADLAFQIGKIVQQKLDWALEEIEDKLTQKR